MTTIIGIDPSLTRTGIAIGDERECWVTECTSRPRGDALADRVERYVALASHILEHVEPAEPRAIYIEGYSFGHNHAGQRWLVEFGGVLRWHLVDVCRVVEVPPATLKKFVTGKGNSKKETMLAHIASRWGRVFDNADLGDAFGLYRLGLVAEGIVEADNAAQREAVAKLSTDRTR